MPYSQITIEQAQQIIEQGNALLLDIRDPASYAAGHIQNAIALSNENLDDVVADADLDAPTIVYCYHGHSSQNAAQFLADQRGFEQVYSLIGGFTAWPQA